MQALFIKQVITLYTRYYILHTIYYMLYTSNGARVRVSVARHQPANCNGAMCKRSHSKSFSTFLCTHVSGCQNYGPVLGPLNTRCRIVLRTQKGTMILTTTHLRAHMSERTECLHAFMLRMPWGTSMQKHACMQLLAFVYMPAHMPICSMHVRICVHLPLRSCLPVYAHVYLHSRYANVYRGTSVCLRVCDLRVCTCL